MSDDRLSHEPPTDAVADPPVGAGAGAPIDPVDPPVGAGAGAPIDPVGDLVSVVAVSVPGWLERCVVETATRQLGGCPGELRAAAERMAERESDAVVAEVTALVRADVDAQRTTPLTVLRNAVRHPTAVLAAAGVPPVRRDPFVEERFPADVYDLSPAAWADIAPELHDPGLMWGAWKAATVLRRRTAPPTSTGED